MSDRQIEPHQSVEPPPGDGNVNFTEGIFDNSGTVSELANPETETSVVSPTYMASTNTNDNMDELSLDSSSHKKTADSISPNCLDSRSENTSETIEDKKALFWRTLTFWQKASEIDHISSTEKKDQLKQELTELVHNSNTKIPPQVDNNSTHNEEACNNVAITQSSTVVTETFMESTETSQAIANSIVTIESDSNGNFIWDMTRRVSYIPFLQPKVELSTTATVTSNPGDNQFGSIDTQQPTESDETNVQAVSNSWWRPWSWNSANNTLEIIDESVSDIGGGLVEDELLKVQRKEVSNQIKCQSYGIPKSVTWGMFRHSGDDYGYACITGNSYKKPVMLKTLPASMFEVNEQSFFKKTDADAKDASLIDSVVLPEIGWNYRNLTWRTQCRIALSKVPKLERIFSSQNHLYYNNKIKNQSKSGQKVEKKVIVVCFHGFLPQKIVKNVIGEPTGTSEQMSKVAINELKRWSDINNIDIDINVINLEGHGKIFEQVNGCLSILENWMDAISGCDYFLGISSSHCVPLSIHVLAKLITSGSLENVAKMGLIALSGLSLGPISEVESKISTRGSVGQDNDIISELFDLEDPDSLQSRELVRNMRILIKQNFKITFLGSLNDCFSPLYSSLALHLNHPNIYRALYVDGKDHQPDFLISLFNLVLTLRNLGYPDHGFLIELSDFFKGQIGEGGHCKLVHNKYGYRIGIHNMLNTSNLFYAQPLAEEMTNIKEYNTNSYHIPWCLRGFLEELEKIQKHFDVPQIIEQLFEEFKSWDPESQRKKDLKYCMQAFENVLNEDLGL